MNDDVREVEVLLELMHEHDLDALTLRDGEKKYSLVRRRPQAAAVQPPVRAVAAHDSAPAPAPSTAKKVTAPIVGVFYSAPSPGAEPFVSVGQRVTVGQVVCILEAMKLMNEITSDYAGVVTRIIPENGELVSLGEEMFWIEP